MPRTHPLRPEDPQELGGYRLKGLLGVGGQGTVYHGVAPDATEVAIKLLHPQFADDERTRKWLEREFNIATRVHHFTARVLHSGIHSGAPYIVSEYIDGPSLDGHIDARGPLGEEELFRLAIGTITALCAIHNAGIVHCDFKPGNILLGPDGPRVIDFGIARALSTLSTRASGNIGTPAFMAPEQISNSHQMGPYTDVFAWASTVVYAATGTPAFGNDEFNRNVMHHILKDEPDLRGVPEELCELLYACLAKDPDARPTAAVVEYRLRGDQTAPSPIPLGRRIGEDLTGHTALVNAIALTELGGRTVAVSAAQDRTARIWDLAEQSQLGAPLEHTASVLAVACGRIGDLRVAVTGGQDGRILVWDLRTGRPVGVPMTGHSGAVLDLALSEVDGVPVAVSVGIDRSVRIWNLRELRQQGPPLVPNTAVPSLACTVIEGDPVVLVGGVHDRQVRVWSLRDLSPRPVTLNGHTDTVKDVACGLIDERPAAFTCGYDKCVRVWDLLTGREIARLQHASAVISAAPGRIGARPVLLTSGADRRVALWDLTTMNTLSESLAEGARTAPPLVVAQGQIDGRPAAVITGQTQALRLWSLGPAYLR
ncbi:serine/threonine-protein kinase [Actinocorallia longicatena]|uniref:Protein kinase domain-containing protein n=1 Tax=Actinocorallia longicatena TaxID=111803 RepID=A0ABP6Q0F9_9ACTN